MKHPKKVSREFIPPKACARPKPVIWGDHYHAPRVVCSECGWTLGLLEYEQGCFRMRWWRHRWPPVPMAAAPSPLLPSPLRAAMPVPA